MIDGVVISPLRVYYDDRGSLFEVVHNYEMPGGRWGDLSGLIPGNFGQVYVVRNPVRGTIRAFHRHEKLWDYFCIISGSAKFCLIKAPLGETMVHVMSGEKPELLIVPPGVFHGWMSLEDRTVLLSVGSELYNRAMPDEERVPASHFDTDFGGSPWVVRGR